MRESYKVLVYNIIIFTPTKRICMRTNAPYQNAMINFIKEQPCQMASGQELVHVYNSVANYVNPEISRRHIPLNVHFFAKTYGTKIGTFITENGRRSSLYQFNFNH
jgi:hypothetical protein